MDSEGKIDLKKRNLQSWLLFSIKRPYSPLLVTGYISLSTKSLTSKHNCLSHILRIYSQYGTVNKQR